MCWINTSRSPRYASSGWRGELGWAAASGWCAACHEAHSAVGRAMQIAIVGGGWAGLSAAHTAAQMGHNVHVFESAGTLGGRARSVHSPTLNTAIDNGQHILLGAYTATLELMQALGLNTEQAFIRLPLSLRSADGNLHMRAPAGLPAPFHIVAGLLSARGLTWGEKQAVLRAMSQLRRANWKMPRAATVQEWLTLTRQPLRLQRLIWAPLCV